MSHSSSILTGKFAGKGLSWFGSIPTELSHNSTSATYAIDDRDPVTFRLNGLPQGATPTLYNQIFFSTPELPAGRHSLHVVHGGTDGETPLTLDYLIITNSSSIPNSTSIPNASTPSTSDNPVHQTPIGAIVGGVVGGVVLVILLLVLLLWKRRRRRGVQLQGGVRPPPEASPLMVSNYSTLSSNISQPTSVSPVTDPRHSSLYPLSVTSDGPSMSISTGIPMSSSESSPGTEPLGMAIRKQAQQLMRLEYIHPEPVVHQDSGQRFRRGEYTTDIPPGYSAD